MNRAIKIFLFFNFFIVLFAQNAEEKVFNKLTKEEENVIIHKGTEIPFKGQYNNFFKNGIYKCKRCNAYLFKSEHKFSSHCGWPSFDDEIKGSIKRQLDTDGIRTEIICSNCSAHLGHVFEGENFTEKNLRHCVNSISLVFVPYEKAYFAGGCFWGVEHLFQKKPGVASAVSGYMGGKLENPTYNDVCYKNTGHLEVVEVTYNPEEINFEELAKFFFEIHDFTQKNGQGPDIGEQYMSAIFYNNSSEKETLIKLIKILETKKYKVETKLLPLAIFYKAEEYHQDYYEKTKKQPYCHFYKSKF